MKRLAFIFDSIFTFFSVGLFTLCFFRYLKINLTLACVLSLFCGILGAFAYACFLLNKRKGTLLKRAEEKEKDKLLTHLAFLSDEEKTNYFLQALLKNDPSAKRFGKLRIYTEDEFYTLRFDYAPVTADDVLKISRFKTKKEKILLCAVADDHAYALADKLGIKLLQGDSVYQRLKEENALPKNYLGIEEKRKTRAKRYFSRANAKRFLIASMLLLFSALLSPFPYYYLLSSGILLLSSLCIKIFGFSEQ